MSRAHDGRGPGRARRGTTERDVVYGTAGGVDLKLDLYFPRTAGPWPLVVAVHGGGWSEGDKAGFALPAARRRYLLASINYRLHPAFRFPAMIEDVALAIRFLRSRATEYHLDPERVALLGHSAGGHLCALAGLLDGAAGWDVGAHAGLPSTVKAVVALAAPTDLCRRFPDPGAEGLRFSVFGESQWEAASPARRVGASSPAFLIVHGDRDAVVPVEHAHALHDALRAKGRPSRLVVVRGAGHGFAPVGGGILARPLAAVNLLRVTRHVLRFLDHHLRRRRLP